MKFELFFSKGTWFYIASWKQGFESGWSVIVLGIGFAKYDRPFNRLRREWVIPSNAWDGKNLL